MICNSGKSDVRSVHPAAFIGRFCATGHERLQPRAVCDAVFGLSAGGEVAQEGVIAVHMTAVPADGVLGRQEGAAGRGVISLM